MIADAQRAAFGADIALANSGGIRGDKIYEAGSKISRRDILTELPFGNVNILLEIEGSALLAALENGVSDVENVAGRFPQVSGMTFSYDGSKPAGSRVENVMIGASPLDPSASYKLATNDYIARGGDGYKSLKSAKVLIDKNSAKLLANDVMVYVRQQGTIAPKVEGRIVAK